MSSSVFLILLVAKMMLKETIGSFSGSLLAWGRVYTRSHCTRNLGGIQSSGSGWCWLQDGGKSMVDKGADTLAHKESLEYLALLREGCNNCWSWQFLDAMTTIKVIDPKNWKPRYIKGCDDLTCLRFDEEIISGKAEEWFDRAWDTCTSDTENAGGGGEVFKSTYKHWIGYQGGTCAMYLQRCIPPGLRRQLTEIGLNCHNLAIHEQRRENVDRQHRYCKVCNLVAMGGEGQVKEVKDSMHFML